MQKFTKKEYKLCEQSLKNQYENQLRFKDEKIERYKDFKAKLSRKMVGKTLERHCEIKFNRLRATEFQNAYFEKIIMRKAEVKAITTKEIMMLKVKNLSP